LSGRNGGGTPSAEVSAFRPLTGAFAAVPPASAARTSGVAPAAGPSALDRFDAEDEPSVDPVSVARSGKTHPLLAFAGMLGLAAGISEVLVASKLGAMFWPVGFLMLVAGVGLLGDRRWAYVLSLLAFGINGIWLTGYAWMVADPALWWVSRPVVAASGVLCLCMVGALMVPSIRNRALAARRRGF
jgi:hypothetical protein